jgi:hypothetical protein
MQLHFDRRFFRQAIWLSAQAATAGGLLVARFYSAEAEIEQSRQSKIVQGWMDEWMKREKDVVGALNIARFAKLFVHDCLYWSRITSKVVADKIFQFGKVFPDDPRTSWEFWKKYSAHPV